MYDIKRPHATGSLCIYNPSICNCVCSNFQLIIANLIMNILRALSIVCCEGGQC